MIKLHLLSAILCTLVSPLAAQSRNIEVVPADRYTVESASWIINGETGQAQIRLGKLAFNHSGTTGGIKLTLWASRLPYQSGGKGLTIAESTLNPLRSGQYYTNLNRNCKLLRPAPGTYFLTLMVLEYRNGRYVQQRRVSGRDTFTFR